MNEKIYIPPIKIQGIKTKLVPLIKDNVLLEKDTVWVEPFMGSGVVGFNIQPGKAIFADKNPHIINFYNSIKDKRIDSYIVRNFLEIEGKKLEKKDDEYYYEVRERFNEHHSSLDFLFLNRCCFNGMIRFNKDYKFNVPYGHKRQRFSKAYITKIVNQVKHVEEMIRSSDWEFVQQDFGDTITSISFQKAFIYCDPPYIGRHVDYYDSWDLESEERLNELLSRSNNPFMLSTWDYNQYRKNEYIDKLWGFCKKISKEHFYFIGAKETNRNQIMEALLINYPLDMVQNYYRTINEQLELCIN